MPRAALAHEQPIAMAHRGSRLLWPENTMVAFQGAADLGFTYFETDIRATNDGRLVAFHDATLDRTTDGTGPIRQRSLDDVRELDAAHQFDESGGHPLRGIGVRVPTLEELLLTFPNAVFTLDLKAPGIESLLHSEIRRLEAVDRVIVGSFFDHRLRTFRKLASDQIATSSGPAETTRFLAASRLGRSPKLRADALQVPERAGPVSVVTVATVAAAHAAGKEVHVWTVNERERMSELLDLGVDGIITDRPDILRDVMIERGRGGPWN